MVLLKVSEGLLLCRGFRVFYKILIIFYFGDPKAFKFKVVNVSDFLKSGDSILT